MVSTDLWLARTKGKGEMGKDWEERIGNREGIQVGAREHTAVPGPFSEHFPVFPLFRFTTFTG